MSCMWEYLWNNNQLITRAITFFNLNKLNVLAVQENHAACLVFFTSTIT